jgi:putative ABC transport system permease protein
MNFLLLGDDSAERVNTAVVSANFFDVLGVRPLLGRTFIASDEERGAQAVLVLSYEYWKGRYGADPNIIGRVFQMNNRPHTVIGVLPQIPQYPVTNDVYMPTSQCPFRSSAEMIADRKMRMMTAFGRLKPGVSVEQAQADLGTMAHQMEQDHPDVYPAGEGYAMNVAPLQEDLTRRARTTFLVLLGAAGFVLLIACANVANLLFARLLKVERELAIRTALGASRVRLVRQMLTESVMLSLAGGALGLALAPGALAVLAKFAERFTTRAAEIKMDGPVLGFTLAVSLLTGVLFGLVPAFSMGKKVGESLKRAGGRNGASLGHQRLRGALVVAQVAVSFLLLIGAGLMMRSFVKLQNQNPGFSTDRVLAMRLSPNFSKYMDMAKLLPVGENLLRRVREVPGVESAALATTFPFNPGSLATGPGSTSFQIEGRATSKGELAPQVAAVVVSPDYFQTLRQPIVEGRAFTEHDDAKALAAAVINQTMARHRWPGEDPVGKRISFDQGKTWVQIAGIVGDAKEYGLDHAVRDEIYAPMAQNGFGNNLLIRTTGDPMGAAQAVRAAIHSVDAQIAIDRMNTMERFQHDSVASPRVMTILLGLFAGLAVLISSCGIAAAMALSVSQRRNEFGIRMALGASRESIVSMVVRQGLLLALAGAAIGLAGAVGLTRLLASLLYSTSPTDTFTFAAVSLLFLTIAAVASFVPARQVTAIDPLAALRQE